MEKVKMFFKRNKKIIVPIIVVLLLAIGVGACLGVRLGAAPFQSMEKEVSFGQVSSSENSKLNENKAAEKKDDSSKAGASKAESSQTENTSKPDSSSKETDNAGNSSTSGGSAGVESGSAASGSGRGGDGGSAHTPQSSASSHSHVWKDHIATKQVWVPNMVTVDDYETQTISGAQFYTFSGYNELGQPTYTSDGPTYWFENGFTMDDLKEIIVEGLRNADETGCYNGVYYGNYVNRTKTENIKVGSHQEDHGSYQTETYVDYQYCDCGARR